MRVDVRPGTVIGFDDAAGLGVIATDDGAEIPFHCIEIADGTRTVEVGQSVWFRPLAKLGRVEAGAIVKV